MKKTYPRPRRQVRLDAKVPVRVRGRECEDHEWVELTHFVNISPIGARFLLSQPTEPGRLLHTTSSLPRQLRAFDLSENQYRLWVMVTNVNFLSIGITTPLQAEVGVAFLGPRAPAGYDTNPAQLYELTNEPTGADLWQARPYQGTGIKYIDRLETRHPIAIEVTLDTYSASGQKGESETTVTENISESGAAIFTTSEIQVGRFVRLTAHRPSVTLLAVVRAKRLGEDGRARLHLEFISRKWPLEGVEISQD